ncbi:MAG: CotH kinase family protein [Bacteroidia bacterium]|nr:CotH kinase family protein [Bacteroidia bacterium]
MKALLHLLVIGLTASVACAQEADSSAMLFDDTVVHEFNIHFYTEHWQDSLLYYYNQDEEYIPARVEYHGMVFDSVGVRYKGNSSFVQSRSTPKKPFKLKFDEYRSKQSCFGITRLNFSNGVKDPSFMREKLAYDILRTILPSPRAAFATLSVDGALLGLYTQVEQVDKKFLSRHFEDNDFNLYKAADNGATLEYRGDGGEQYEREFELKTNESTNDWSRLVAMIDVVNHTAGAHFVERAGALLDLGNCIRMNAFNMAASHFDSYTGSGRNFYLYDDESTGRFVFIPWDANEAFGAYSNNWNVITQDILSIPSLEKRPAFARILENDSLRSEYLRYIRALAQGPLSLDSMTTRVLHWKTFLDPLVQADPHKLYSYQQFLDNIEKDVVVGINMTIPGLLRFAKLRSERVIAQADAYLAGGSGAVLPNNPILLFDVYPNPATDAGMLRFQLLYGGAVSLLAVDMAGRIVFDHALGWFTPGLHETAAPAATLPSGSFIWKLRVSGGGDASFFSSGTKVLKLR